MTPAEASKRFPNFFKISEVDGVPELYCDHHMLSTLRLCEGKFLMEFVYNVKAKGRSWSLDFGIWLHHALEKFYKHLQSQKTVDTAFLQEWADYGNAKWIEMKMDEYAEGAPHYDSRYKLIGGWDGAKALLAHYWIFFGGGSERLRVVATEVPFGRAKEVPIIGDEKAFPFAPFRAYLCGRIDLLVDDGFRIGPIDHKSASRFSGKEHTNFNPQEAVSGYVLATRNIVDKLFPDLKSQGRLCESMWINHISLQVCKERFKRTRITKNAEQLEEFRRRQVGSFAKLWSILIDERPADWNAYVCDNIYHRQCEYKGIHEQGRADQLQIIQANFVKGDAWNPYQTE